MSKRASRINNPQVRLFVSASPESNSSADGNDLHHPEIMSKPEKEMLCIMQPEAKELPYPLRPLKMAYGPDALEYVIPQKEIAEVLKKIYPFVPCPEITEERFDIHEQKSFCIKDFRVIRERNRNFLVSPYFPRSGGMVVDWLPIGQDCMAQIIATDESSPLTNNP